MVTHYKKLTKPRKSEVYNTYWKFAVKRNEIFLKRFEGKLGPWTNDSILQEYKFTNVFRAADRVSQYLISIQYQEEKASIQNIFFKTLLFKLFNRIETYKYLETVAGNIQHENFIFTQYDKALTQRLACGQKIYSAAYIMPSAGNVFQFKYKHSNHLALLAKMIEDDMPQKVVECKSLENVFQLLLSYPSLGRFLAFQYTIDINYSSLTNFSENDFVVAGPGAINGINKCFQNLGGFCYEDIIKWMCDNQEKECENLELKCPTLFGRSLQLIDCQNLFCEVDKYLRASNPGLNGESGRTRIKQKYQNVREPINYFFPPKWKINQNLKKLWKEKAKENIFS